MFPISRIPAPRTLDLSQALDLPKEADYVVLWYGANARARTQGVVPTVYVWFRRLYPNDQFGAWVRRRLAATFLGQLRIGSIWRNGISTHEIKFFEFLYTGRYMESQWDDIIWEQRQPGLIPQDRYPLPFGRSDQSRLLRLRAEGTTLLVPCMEFFTRCYARSGEVNRILLTYGVEEQNERLMLQEPIESISGVRSVWMPPYATDADAHFLAQLRYDPKIASRLQAFSATLDQELYASRRDFAFLAFGPWYYGSAQLKVQGIPLDNGDFLGLRIVGHTLPTEHPVHTLRVHMEPDTESELAHVPLPRREVHEVPEGQTVPATQELNADQDTDILVANDPDIEILNSPAPVTREIVKRDRNGRTIRTPSAPSSCSAPGSAYGTGKGIASLHVQSDTVTAAKGAVLELWDGLVYLKEANPGLISSVSWCRPNHTFQGPPVPPEPGFNLPNLKFDNNVQKLRNTRAWLHRSGLPSARRSIFVFRIQTPYLTGYLFEVQRAERETKKDNGEKEYSEESYSGLAAIPKDDCDLPRWLDTIFSAISLRLGIMPKVVPDIEDITVQQSHYQRTRRHGDAIAGQATAFNALCKLGINNLNYSLLKNSTTSKG